MITRIEYRNKAATKRACIRIGGRGWIVEMGRWHPSVRHWADIPTKGTRSLKEAQALARKWVSR